MDQLWEKRYHLLNNEIDESAPSDFLITELSSEQEKIALFRSLFRGREDVFPKRFESKKTKRRGYQPYCKNEWIKGLCSKPKIKCSKCNNRELIPVTNDVIKSHLLGSDLIKKSYGDFTIGVYPLLPDETCWFLAADFDKDTWMEDVAAYLSTCDIYQVPAALERSRSGNGGHVWIFFSDKVDAQLARKMGAFLLTETMERRPEIGLDSYDRFFPSQDTMPQGGFGSLIALPLQKTPSENGNSLFIDRNFSPYEDQWAYLSSIRRMNRQEIEAIVSKAERKGRIIGVRIAQADREDETPWLAPPSRIKKLNPITGPLPKKITLVLGNQIYLEKAELTNPALKNRLIRLAAFHNPEFYKAQAMRRSTYKTDRIINCCEDFVKHMGIPIGCLEDILCVLDELGIKAEIVDERYTGKYFHARFKGVLRPDQKMAAEAMLQNDTGVMAASTAFGKTIIGIYLISERCVNTLILVHRKQLLDQWISRLKTFLEIPEDAIGQISGGKWTPTFKIDVATIQSLRKKGIVNDVVGQYGHLIIDECHIVPARSFEIVARQCKARYITGLSATVTRKDGHHPIIFMNCGPVRYRVDDKKQAVQRPFHHKVFIRKTKFSLPTELLNKEILQIHEIYNAMIEDEERNQMIVTDVINAISRKRSPIVLTERISHLEKLASMLSPHTRNLLILRGGMGEKQRRLVAEKLQSIQDDEERLIIATGRYLGEGFDDNRLDTLFLTLPVSWKGTIAQYAGRLHRLYKMKNEVLIFDYSDLELPMLEKMHKKRLSGYRSIGYEIDDTMIM